MKAEKVWSSLIGAALSFGAAFAGAGCMVSAFGFDADMKAVATGILLCAAVAAVCFSVKFGALLLAGICALLFGYLSRQGEFFLEFEALVYRISEFYHKGYGWPVAQWSKNAELSAVPIEGGLLLIAGVVTILLCRMLCRRKRAIVPVVVSLVPLFACSVVTDTIPGETYLFLLLAVLAIILLTQAARRESEAQGRRLTAMLLVPVVLAASLMGNLLPREEYVHQTQAWQQWLVGMFEGILGIQGDLPVNPGIQSEFIDLTAVGEKKKVNYAVMDVVSSQTETLYLRGQAYDEYDGLFWSVSEYVDQNGAYWPTEQVAAAGTVTIETRTVNPIKYFPYYPAGLHWLGNFDQGAMDNPNGEKTYSFYRVSTVPGQYSTDSAELLGQCTTLPESTRQAAEKILEEIWGSQGTYTEIIDGYVVVTLYSDSQKITMIEEYIRGSAEYDLNTSRMPEDAEDFAIWFLKESDTGYCTHFATAAVVLLRAAGIPARYVTGYMADVTEGVKTTVTVDMAHAWVEYLDPISGCWTVLDPTPGGGSSVIPTQPSEETDPSDTSAGQDETTEPSAEPTLPSKTTEPSEPPTVDPTTGTSQPVAPTETVDPTESTHQTGGGIGPGGTADNSQLWTILKWIAVLVAVLAVTVIQYLLRLRIRRKRLYTGPSNQQALRRWRYVLWVGRYMRRKPPERLKELAEKAKFSQHTLTDGELAEFDGWLEKMRNIIQRKPWLQRMLIKLIWAVE